ncbi:MAG TPA: hypothetical protein VJH75_04015 [Patescibacteria group bacterium]|nr:hypothetical protein [Patescibacteria group bacterium]
MSDHFSEGGEEGATIFKVNLKERQKERERSLIKSFESALSGQSPVNKEALKTWRDIRDAIKGRERSGAARALYLKIRELEPLLSEREEVVAESTTGERRRDLLSARAQEIDQIFLDFLRSYARELGLRKDLTPRISECLKDTQQGLDVLEGISETNLQADHLVPLFVDQMISYIRGIQKEYVEGRALDLPLIARLAAVLKDITEQVRSPRQGGKEETTYANIPNWEVMSLARMCGVLNMYAPRKVRDNVKTGLVLTDVSSLNEIDRPVFMAKVSLGYQRLRNSLGVGLRDGVEQVLPGFSVLPFDLDSSLNTLMSRWPEEDTTRLKLLALKRCLQVYGLASKRREACAEIVASKFAPDLSGRGKTEMQIDQMGERLVTVIKDLNLHCVRFGQGGKAAELEDALTPSIISEFEQPGIWGSVHTPNWWWVRLYKHYISS